MFILLHLQEVLLDFDWKYIMVQIILCFFFISFFSTVYCFCFFILHPGFNHNLLPGETHEAFNIVKNKTESVTNGTSVVPQYEIETDPALTYRRSVRGMVYF